MATADVLCVLSCAVRLSSYLLTTGPAPVVILVQSTFSSFAFSVERRRSRAPSHTLRPVCGSYFSLADMSSIQSFWQVNLQISSSAILNREHQRIQKEAPYQIGKGPLLNYHYYRCGTICKQLDFQSFLLSITLTALPSCRGRLAGSTSLTVAPTPSTE